MAKKITNGTKEYERLKKELKDCEPNEYEKKIKDICKKIKY